MCRFSWVQYLNTNQDPNWQVQTFTKIFMNIMTNFIPNEIKRIVPRDPPWITKPLKLCLIGRIDSLKTTKDMGINQRTKLDFTLFVKNVKRQLKLPN